MACHMARSAAVALVSFNAFPGSEAIGYKAQGPEVFGAFKDIRSRVGALEATLAEAEENNRQNLVKLQDTLETELHEAKEKTKEIAFQSKDVASEIESVVKENNAIRDHANQIQLENTKWLEDFQAWKGNWTSALEVTGRIIDNATAPLPELDILGKLDVEDAKRSENKEHASRIAQIDRAVQFVSLLSTSTLHKIDDTPKALLGDLSSGLDAMNSEYEEKVAEIKAKYNSELAKEKELQTKLTKELETLNGALKKQNHLNEELLVAQRKLEERRSLLEKQAYAMRVYAQRLASKILPNKAMHLELSNANSTEANKTSSPKADGLVMLHEDDVSSDFAKGARQLTKWLR